MRLTLALTAVLAATTVTATEPRLVHVAEGVDYVIPTGSPIVLASKGPHLLATFKGRFRISGTYHYGWLTDGPPATAADVDLDLYFIPDKAIADLLPYWAPRGRVHEIRFRNSNAFIRAVISPGLLEKVQKQEILSVTGTATILVEKYQVDVECDYPIYSVAFSSVVQPATLVASRSVVDQYGC